MKARLVKNDNKDLFLLCNDGTYLIPSKSDLGDLLFRFKNIDSLSGDAGNWSQEYPEMAAFPGQTLAFVTDTHQLVIDDFSPFHTIIEAESDPKWLGNLLSVQEYAQKHNKSVEQIKVFCRKGRIAGAKKIGRDWVIHADTPYPYDGRVSSGRNMSK